MPDQSAPIHLSALHPMDGPPIERGTARSAKVAAVIIAAALSACAQRDRGADAAVAPPGARTAESAYRPPPSAIAAQRGAGGTIILVGRADPQARIRLAAPEGALTSTSVDGRGGWRARLTPAADMRLFGLAAIERGRTLQAEGYLAVTPNGLAAQLRAGAGAKVLGAGGPLRILAIDYDRKGGTVVSGAGRPGATVTLMADGVRRGQVAADRDGGFALAFDEPLAPGVHSVQADSGGERAVSEITVTPAAPLTKAPFRANREAGAWRVDWLTPGGGIQTTLLLSPQEDPA